MRQTLRQAIATGHLAGQLAIPQAAYDHCGTMSAALALATNKGTAPSNNTNYDRHGVRFRSAI